MPRDTENRDPLIALRIPPALDQRLRAHAATTGSSLSEIVRGAIEQRLAPIKPHYEPVTTTSPTATRRLAKHAGMCEHRVRQGNYCRRCDGVI